MPPVTPNWTDGRDLSLLIESYSNATQILQVRGVCETEAINASHTTNSDRSLATSVVSVNSVPKFLMVKPASTSVKRGGCYVKVSLQAEGVIIARLCQGYVTDSGGISFPGGHNVSSTEGPGQIRSITGTNPAAGIEILETVPTGARWRLISFFTPFVTDATVINRTPRIIIDDGTTKIIDSASTAAVAAGTTTSFDAGDFGSVLSTPSLGRTIGLPSLLYLTAGYRIQTVTINMQAGDDYGAPLYSVEEWMEP